MIPRIRTGLVTRNPYYLSDATWGITYVTHGLAGVGLVGLVIAHVYFADPAREVVDHQVDDPRLHHAAAVSRAPRAEPLAGRRRRARPRSPRARREPDASTVAELGSRINTIEEAYEFMLAYASQGLASDQDNDTGRQAREYLKKCDAALSGLAGVIDPLRRSTGLQPTAPYDAFIDVIERDASDAQAAIQLVLAQPAISSQMVDNLNASIHLRALLTDLFLIDEIFKSRR